MYINCLMDLNTSKLNKYFQYEVPKELEDQISIGTVVKVPFGNANHLKRAYVIEKDVELNWDKTKVKQVVQIDPKALSPEEKLFQLAIWMSQEYATSLIKCLKTVLPVKNKLKIKEESFYELSPEFLDRLEEYMGLYRKKRYFAKLRAIYALLSEGRLSRELLVKKYGVGYQTLQKLNEDKVVLVSVESNYRNTYHQVLLGKENLRLNEEQKKAVDKISQSLEKSEFDKPFLLYGVTGSGKTEVYMELVDRCIQSGKKAIVLIPEIGLTFQTIGRFQKRFGSGRIGVIHSRLSLGERSDQFVRAMEGSIDLMIGPRSALFTPFSDIGLIIIDEEHESSYINESSPNYDAKTVAMYLCQLHKATLILGSATPSIDSYYQTQMEAYHLIKLSHRAGGATPAKINVVDMRQELKAGNQSIFSRLLIQKIKDRFEKKEQSILFMNRRGYAGYLSCRECGYVVKCPHCDVSLTRHKYEGLKCHYCGYQMEDIHTCPSCQSTHLEGMFIGTQQVEEQLKSIYPSLRILRMDVDTVSKKHGHRHIVESFLNEEADVLIGTQMVVKGHDFPKVTLMAALMADISLNINEYTAGEKTYQLLTQATGRAGRDKYPGEMIIQTYQPDNNVIKAVMMEDYSEFYHQEILYRGILSYPPVGHLLRIGLSSLVEPLVDKGALFLAWRIEQLRKQFPIVMIGPTDDTIKKIQDIYRKSIYIKSKDKDVLLSLIKEMNRYIEINSGFQQIKIQYEFHPGK